MRLVLVIEEEERHQASLGVKRRDKDRDKDTLGNGQKISPRRRGALRLPVRGVLPLRTSSSTASRRSRSG